MNGDAGSAWLPPLDNDVEFEAFCGAGLTALRPIDGVPPEPGPPSKCPVSSRCSPIRNAVRRYGATISFVFACFGW